MNDHAKLRVLRWTAMGMRDQGIGEYYEKRAVDVLLSELEADGQPGCAPLPSEMIRGRYFTRSKIVEWIAFVVVPLVAAALVWSTL